MTTKQADVFDAIIEQVATNRAEQVAELDPVAIEAASIAALSAAVAAMSDASAVTDIAADTLAECVRARYVIRAQRHLRTVSGVWVLPDNLKSEVTGLLWLDATGHIKPTPAKERTAGERSLGQYISNYHRVATDLIIGIDGLASVELAKECAKSISDANAAEKANQQAAEQALADRADDRAFAEWLSTQKSELQTAFKNVAHALRHDGAPHLSAFTRSVVEPQQNK